MSETNVTVTDVKKACEVYVTVQQRGALTN